MSTFADSQKEDREGSYVYGFAGDGKTYWGFDYEKIDRLMRK